LAAQSSVALTLAAPFVLTVSMLLKSGPVHWMKRTPEPPKL
jgi:hypothetical protein